MKASSPTNDEMPGHLARRFQQLAVAAFQAEMDASGSDLTPVQYAVLTALAERPGIDQATLGAQIALDRATTTGVVDRLQSKGLVERQVSSTDRRARKLDLTPQGEETLELIGPAAQRAQHNMLGRLSSGEATELMRLLHKVIG